MDILERRHRSSDRSWQQDTWMGERRLPTKTAGGNGTL